MNFNSLGAQEFSLHTGGVTGSIPVAPTLKCLAINLLSFVIRFRGGDEFHASCPDVTGSFSPLYQPAR
jgi:hypothetical protein